MILAFSMICKGVTIPNGYSLNRSSKHLGFNPQQWHEQPPCLFHQNYWSRIKNGLNNAFEIGALVFEMQKNFLRSLSISTIAAFCPLPLADNGELLNALPNGMNGQQQMNNNNSRC